MENLGLHNLIELYGCSFDILDNLADMETSMVKAAKDSGATVLNWNFHKFSPQGVTGTVILSESHLSIHTWPEKGYAALDIFTCGNTINHAMLLHDLKTYFQASNSKVLTVKRGILDESADGELVSDDIYAIN